MTGKIGSRTAVLATSGLVSIAVTLGAGAGVAQAAPYGKSPQVKKESTTVTAQRVLWFDSKDKKKHDKKEWLRDGGPISVLEDADPQGGYEDLAAVSGPADFGDLVDPQDLDGFSDVDGFAEPAGIYAPDDSAELLPASDDDLVAADAARYLPQPPHRKHDKVSKRKDSISIERVRWFDGKDKKKHDKKDRPHYYEDFQGEDLEDGWTAADSDPSGDSWGHSEQDAWPAAGEAFSDYGDGAGVYEPVVYRPGGGYDHSKKVVKKKVRITFEKTLWFKNKHRQGGHPWVGGHGPWLPEVTSVPLSGL